MKKITLTAARRSLALVAASGAALSAAALGAPAANAADGSTWDALAPSTLSVYRAAVSPTGEAPLPSQDAKRSPVQR